MTSSAGDLEGRATSTAGLVAPPTESATAKPTPSPLPRRLRQVLALKDFEDAARRFLPRSVYGFIAGAAETDSALRDNFDAFAEWGFLPRYLANVSGRNQAVTLFGREYAAPFGIAPMGASALAAYRGDLVLAGAAAMANLPMIMSASSLIRMEDIRKAHCHWYQAYQPGEPERIRQLVDRVEAAKFETFVLTVDIPVPANRENNVRSGYSMPLKITPRLAWDSLSHPGWLFGTWLRTIRKHGMPHFENMDAHRGPPILSKNLVREVGARDQLSWEHLALIRRRWKGNLVVKGILSPEDARLAREHGADGIILSNHGGRQLDYAVSALRVLPEIADLAGNMVVMLDGGVRRGTDVLKALALGAKFVFVGRPFLCAAAIGGQRGVTHGINILSEEIDRDLALLGLRDVADLGHGNLRRLRGA
ncbi:alpha-hydroxy acid oxidase [Enterovirga rhinocerotis]|uniref:L-lactate dehydrogenase (Cytochrome) n=1 Tax=Enterovirga rhinocerotis TaxID=1339210 RepID=A0A4R7BTS1_9HYPH|nr:alpha-hydroxy acid oxidase [Enterovirga rhinocerotis]TDR87965.1 L-lactate dehydrogenase (cytochrome) [Enterovirga rhinocerotis]